MCNLERWTYINANGTRYPRQRLVPCDRTNGYPSCNQSSVDTMNYEYDVLRSPKPPAMMGQGVQLAQPQTSPASPPQMKKKKKKKKKGKNDLRLDFNFHIPFTSRNKQKPKPKPSLAMASGLPLFSTNQPLIINAPAPASPRSWPDPALVPFAPRTPPRTPRAQSLPRGARIYRTEPEPEPERQHDRRQRFYNPFRRSHSGRRASPAREHARRPRAEHRDNHREHPREDHRPERRSEQRNRAPSPTPRQREESARARAREQAAAEREIARTEAQIQQLRAERERARQDLRRQAEITRLDNEIAVLQAEYERRRRRRQAANAVVHNDPYDDDYDDYYRRPGFRGGGRGRSPIIDRDIGALRNLFRMQSRSSERGRGAGRGVRHIEPPRRGESIPLRRVRSLSEVRPAIPRPRRERVEYDDHPRGGYRRHI